MMASETLGIDQWITSVLSSDATITAAVGTRIYAELAPQGTAFPYIVFRSISSIDVVTTSAARIMVTEQRLVEAITEGESYAPLRTIVDRIDALLHRKPDPGSTIAGSWTGTTILSSDRQRVSRLAENEDGRHYRRLGAVYNISAQ